MRSSITIEDELFASARKYAGVEDVSAIVDKALRAYVEIEAGRRLAKLGGSFPGANAPPRRRPIL